MCMCVYIYREREIHYVLTLAHVARRGEYMVSGHVVVTCTGAAQRTYMYICIYIYTYMYITCIHTYIYI